MERLRRLGRNVRDSFLTTWYGDLYGEDVTYGWIPWKGATGDVLREDAFGVGDQASSEHNPVLCSPIVAEIQFVRSVSALQLSLRGAENERRSNLDCQRSRVKRGSLAMTQEARSSYLVKRRIVRRTNW